MARFPCGSCTGPIRGKAFYAYPTVYVQDDQFGERLRLCEKCAQETLLSMGRRVTNKLDGNCCFIEHSGPTPATAAGYAYLTIYDRASDRQDFGGPVCANDLPVVAAMMRVGLPQRG